MFEILTLNEISDKIFTVLGDNYAVSKDSKSPDAILVRSADMHSYQINDNLLAIARAGAGVNNIPLPETTAAGIAVFNTPGANANAVKELTIAALFLCSRDVVGGINFSNSLAGKEDVPKLAEKGKSRFAGCEISGKTLGVVGLGAIGVKVANAALALGMKVIGADPFLTPENKNSLSPEVLISDNETVFEKSDFITLHLPLTPSTANMICSESLAKMKKGVALINFSRAELVNLQEVKAAIKEGKLSRYVVDFPTEDALNSEKIIVFPHIGASTAEAEENCAIMAAEELKDYLENGNIKNSVNLPALKKERTGKNRVSIIFKNEIEADVKKIISESPYSAAYSKNKAVSYALLDSDAETEEIIDKLSETEGIISIRIL
jgi:Phosphoglycerate dehydrogenase and related dehydrogenases